MRPKPEGPSFSGVTDARDHLRRQRAYEQELVVWAAEAMQDAAGRVERAVTRLENALTRRPVNWTNEEPERCYAFFSGIFRCDKEVGHAGPHQHMSTTDGRSVSW